MSHIPTQAEMQRRWLKLEQRIWAGCVRDCKRLQAESKIMKQDEIDRALILVYASNNAHMWVNYKISSERMERFCQTPKAKAELIQILRNMADRLEQTGTP